MRKTPIPLLSPDPHGPFPEVTSALREPDGLLAVGGDLSPTRLLNAYRSGIFPWFSDGQPILWWSPDPRMVFRPQTFCLQSRFLRRLRKSSWTLRADTSFASVITHCATSPRRGQDGTWITADMIAAYVQLHRLGHAHSVEVFSSGALIGGIYGVAIGQAFFGESMFSRESGASKVALAGLTWLLRQWDWPLLDAQVENAHLQSLGAVQLPRRQFIAEIQGLVQRPGRVGSWSADLPDVHAHVLCKSLD